jgi:hypothetical protein
VAILVSRSGAAEVSSLLAHKDMLLRKSLPTFRKKSLCVYLQCKAVQEDKPETSEAVSSGLKDMRTCG